MYPLYQDTYTVFLNPYSKNINPIEVLSSAQNNGASFFDPALDVGDYCTITLTAQAINPQTEPYYIIFKLPMSLTPQNDQLSPAFPSCPFEFCLTEPNINYVVIKTLADPLSFAVNIKNYPIAISRTDTIFEGLVIEGGRIAGKLIYNITSAIKWK